MGKKLDITEQVLMSLRKIIRAVDLHSKKLVNRCGLTGPQLVVLKQMAAYKEITTGTLSRNVNLSQPTVTSILDRLEKRDLLVRRRDTNDKRKVFVNITEAGRQLLNEAPSPLQDEFTRRFNMLESWEQSLMLSTLQRVGHMMNAEVMSEEL